MIFFYTSAFLTLAAAALSVSLANPVRCVMLLVLSFISSAFSFVLIGAEYIAMTLIIVYAGAVAILFLFVVMMLDLGFKYKKNSVQGSLLFFFLPTSILASFFYAVYLGKLVINTDTYIKLSTIHEIASQLYQGQKLIMLGCVLLVAMVGAIIITFKSEQDQKKRQNTFEQAHRAKSDCISLVNIESGKGVDI